MKVAREGLVFCLPALILAAGLLVWWLGSNWPDLLVGFLTAIIAIKGGVEILRDARKEARQAKEANRCSP